MTNLFTGQTMHIIYGQAGFFIRLVAADVLDGGEKDEVGLPCCLVLTCTHELSMVSRVHSDTLRTLVVGPGLCGEVHVSVSLDVYGTLVFQRDDEQLFSLSIGTAFRGELTVWQMLLRGKDTQISRIFRSMDIEDSEATLSEHLGDAVLRLRHLGSHADGVMLLNRNSISRPGGDHGPSDGISAKVQKNSQADPDPDLYLGFVSSLLQVALYGAFLCFLPCLCISRIYS